MAKLLSCILGPRLYRVYRDRSLGRAQLPPSSSPEAAPANPDTTWESYYQPRTLEKHSDSILALVCTSCSPPREPRSPGSQPPLL
uniref:Phosphatidylserine Lipase ABHD16 N-terminal domain-containing protein n=1 Tax=Sphenodon punctatus TaxID=8508 RepID=A0A8D0GSA7_SPHPU